MPNTLETLLPTNGAPTAPAKPPLDVRYPLLALRLRCVAAEERAEIAMHAAGAKLTVPQAVALVSILHDAPLSQHQIVQATSIDRSTLADVVGRLEAAGLVTRKRDRLDARKWQVRLTPEGERAAKIAARVLSQPLQRGRA